MKQLPKLRTLRTLSNTVHSNTVDAEIPQVRDHPLVAVTPQTTANNHSSSASKGSGGGQHIKKGFSFEDDSNHDERGCIEAVSALLAGIANAYHTPGDENDGLAASPALLQTSKGAGTIECRDSAQELLRFFGHAPLLYLEGVIMVKASGERGILHNFTRAKRNISDRIVEIPFSSIVDVAMVGGREHLNTFGSLEANSLSRPFRIVTTAAPRGGVVTGPATDGQLEGSARGQEKYRDFLLVGFENICRLRHLLVLACESWAVRTSATFPGPVREMLSCAPPAAERYISEVFHALTGPLRDKVDSQVELMEDLADEMILDVVIKERFFSSGDLFFEIARKLADAAAAAAAAESAAVEENATADVVDDNPQGSSRRGSQWVVVTDARFVSAAAAVLDAAFFHSFQCPQRVDLVRRANPTALPLVAENLLYVYCDLRRRITRQDGGPDCGGLTDGTHGLQGVSPVGFQCFAEGTNDTAGSVLSWDDVSTGVLDRVVRALNGMSDVISLFNMENEKLGLVRNLVGVGLGAKVRSGIHPAASDALALVVGVNDRAVALIEELDLWEQKRRQMEAQRLLALEQSRVSSPSEKKKGRRRSILVRFSSFSPRLRSPKTLTPPVTPAVSPTNSKPIAQASLVDGDDLENGPVPAEAPGARGGVPPAQSKAPPIPFETPSPRGFLRSAPVLLHSYAKLLKALVCGSYNLREAFLSSCEADVRNIGREGGYLDILAGLDGGAPRMIFKQTALFFEEILMECRL